ncbi:sirohydrochlorin nickelochelatase [Methanoplanus endosymbiosus]|uniref:Sirohydrochlorin nickelochelatase n=1 Tax=Methanoplanus endosymbiosus TaxID=33865 RepID=A0A9E7PKZ6_9EURY|nr:sirohydrochlorin nickelochelatase [Methanoplanus endosymbiosus]UUX92089.1 sirohydrochlorin nickelochelatase [Methanoplanus endosymbiosus]
MVKKGFLLVGHGSKKPYNKQLIESTAAIISGKEDGYIVKSAFMENSSPTIQEMLDEFKKEEIDTLIVVPLFLARGIHIDKDIPGILGLEEGGHKGTFTTDAGDVPLVFAQPIGDNPMLADLMIESANLALDNYL